MSSGNSNNSNIFDRLDTINESLDAVSKRLATLESSGTPGKTPSHEPETDSIRLIPEIIERISACASTDEVVDELLETFQMFMDRGMVLSYRDGKYYPVMSRGYDPLPEQLLASGTDSAGLLGTSIASRQILIIKGNLGEQVPFAYRNDTRIRYGIIIPFLFGDQVPLTYFGESLESPNPDFLESVVNISTLAMKNLRLSDLLAHERVAEEPEPEPVTEEIPVEPSPEEEAPEEALPEETMPEEEIIPSEPKAGEEEISETKDKLKKPFRSVHDFDSDIISAEELIRSFNIDINEDISAEISKIEEELGIPDAEDESAAETTEEITILEEEVSADAEPPELEVEIPLDDAADDLILQEEEVSIEIPPEFKTEEIDIEKELARLESEVEAVVPEPEPATPVSPQEEVMEEPDSEIEELPESLVDEAQTFARLLVSEIKLYNEEKVKAGRKEGNIYNRLKEEIDLSRSVYNDRIPEQVRTGTDYFDEELVRILAEGDAAIIGLRR